MMLLACGTPGNWTFAFSLSLGCFLGSVAGCSRHAILKNDLRVSGSLSPDAWGERENELERLQNKPLSWEPAGHSRYPSERGPSSLLVSHVCMLLDHQHLLSPSFSPIPQSQTPGMIVFRILPAAIVA